jgi:uncharacterized protein (TIGR00725 family)
MITSYFINLNLNWFKHVPYPMVLSEFNIVGFMGPGKPEDPDLLEHAFLIGREVAENNWTLLTGGRNAGVMNSASKDENMAGGTVIGILPGDDRLGMSDHVTIPIVTG